MNIGEAIKRAGQILDEERMRPTGGYDPVDPAAAETSLSASSGWLALAALGEIGRQQSLNYERTIRPRRVHESPDKFRFRSVNYELLMALLSQVEVSDRPALTNSLIGRVARPESARKESIPSGRFPTWNGCVSELPLLAEFCVRIGFKQEFLRAMGELHLTAGYVLLLMQLEDMIALNFNLFGDGELEQIGIAISKVRAKVYQKTSQYVPRGQGSRNAPKVRNPEYNSQFVFVGKQIAEICDSIIEECKQARYWYLKGALQQNANLEINLDKSSVEEYLKSLGFSSILLEALNAAEKDFRDSATPFELKNSLGHLRSFLEGLHEQACSSLAAKTNAPVPKKWGKTTEMLRNCAILSQQEEALATSLYTLISDEGVHPLIAEQEYARLLRNMAIEYGLMFLAKLEKAGIKLP